MYSCTIFEKRIYIVIIWANILLINIKIKVIEDRAERKKAWH